MDLKVDRHMREGLPNRKSLRLKGFDYSADGCYFVTVCVKDRKPILSRIVSSEAQSNPRVGTDVLVRPYEMYLTSIGAVVQQTIEFIDNNYDGIQIDHYCIMPDHIHLLVTITQENSSLSDGRGRPSLRDTVNGQQKMDLGSVIRQFKTFTTKRAKEITGDKNRLLWQERFYDHIIRNDEDYAEKWRYIDENPLKYILDSEE